MAALLHHRLDIRRIGAGAKDTVSPLGMLGTAVDLDPYVHTGILRGLAAGNEGLADLFERFLDGNCLGQIIGAYLDTAATDVGSQVDKALAGFNVLLDRGWIGRVKLA